MKRIIFFLVFIFSSCLAFGQRNWSVVSQFTSKYASDYMHPSAFFFNENYGFALFTYYNFVDSSTLYRTTDGGKNWEKMSIGFFDTSDKPGIYYNGRFSSLTFNAPNHIFASSLYYTSSVFDSIDSGRTWKNIYNPNEGNIYFHLGTFYSGDGYFSSNEGVSWITDYSPFNHGSQYVIGNKDNGIACLNGFANSNLLTTDGGLHWIISNTQYQATSGYAVAHTQTYFGLCSPHPDLTFIIRSFDGGLTWKNIDSQQFLVFQLAGTITGSGTVLFAEQSYVSAPYNFPQPPGIIRSLDLGNSWDTTITGPNKQPHGPLSVVSRGAVCFASDDNGRIWKFTDSSLLRPITGDLTINDFSSALSHDTLYSKTCDSTKLSLYYGFKGVDYVKLDSITVEGIPASDYRADFMKDKILMSSRPDTSLVTFFPSLPGTYRINIHSFLLRDDWVLEDTAINLTLVVRPNPPIVEALPKQTIDFGKQILCTSKTITDSFSVSNIGCDSLHIQSITLETDQNPKTDFILPAVSSISIYRSASRKFPVQFKPSNVGIETARIIITSDGGSDTINLKGEGLRDSRSITFSSDTIRSRIFSSSEGYIFMKNFGCRPIEVDSASVSNPISIAQAQLPVGIGTGQTTYIKVVFNPTASAIQRVPVILHCRVFGPTDSMKFDTTVFVITEAIGNSSVNQSAKESGISINFIRPNPAREDIEVNIWSSEAGSFHAEIWDMLGKKLIMKNFEMKSGSNIVHFDLRSVPSGAYLFRLHSAKEKTSQTFMKE